MINENSTTKSSKEYPVLLDKFKAVFADTLILIILMKIITDVFSLFDNVPNTARAIAFLFIFVLYEPLLVSFFGGTIGRRINGIRVKKEADENENISLAMAMVRFITKALLGWISLLTVTSNDKRKAIHDSIVHSVIIYKMESPKPKPA